MTIAVMVRALGLLIVLALGSVAEAQTPDPEGARLFEEGRALAKDGKFAEACDKFARSLELDPAIGTQLNFADCHEKLGRNAEAWRLFDAAADAEKITNPTRAKFARERADQLLPKLGVVVLKVATPGAPRLTISIGGRPVRPAAVVREIVEPGSVEITATASAGAPFQKTIALAAGQSQTIDVPAFPEGGSAELPGDGTQRRRSRVYLAYGVGGAGVLTLVTGVIFGFKAKSDYEEQFSNGRCMEETGSPVCSPDGFAAQNDALTLARVGTVLGVGGIALMAGGAVLFLTAPRDVMVTPTVTSESAGLTVVGKF